MRGGGESSTGGLAGKTHFLRSGRGWERTGGETSSWTTSGTEGWSGRKRARGSEGSTGCRTGSKITEGAGGRPGHWRGGYIAGR